ncbi:hypothetical protein J3E68DRAFT_235122 [Trichoderma sp. SZMC 28012]
MNIFTSLIAFFFFLSFLYTHISHFSVQHIDARKGNAFSLLSIYIPDENLSVQTQLPTPRPPILHVHFPCLRCSPKKANLIAFEDSNYQKTKKD